MLPEKWRSGMFLILVFMLCNTSGAFVGMNVGTDLSNPPSAADVVKILKAQQITHIRLFNADHKMLSALAKTGIEVMVSITNEELLGIGESRSTAADWVNRNVAAFVPATNITAIAVGSEVLTTIPNAYAVLVPAMWYIHSALVASNLNFLVKISTPQSMDVMPKPFPPSTAIFNSTWNNVMWQLLQFLKKTDSYFMLNAHPYYGYTSGNGIFPLDYALSRALPRNKQIVDPNTLLHYTSMFEAMVDAAYYSMEALNVSGIPVLVTETGWPWLGGTNESDATVDNAVVYNNNLIRHVLNGSGTPSQPAMPVSAYIYELFNEDLRPGPTSEKNWGVFFPNGTTVYSLSLSGASQIGGNSSGVGAFCVAKNGVDSSALLAGLNWACGPGSANCTPIQAGQPCYEPNTAENHASYAFNDYFHRTRSSGGTCDFGGSAMISSIDPRRYVFPTHFSHFDLSAASSNLLTIIFQQLEVERKLNDSSIWACRP
ncbi:glucan endo-1,3-beta-glucosidase 4 isoform X2 [Magnolia sinica]|uniref:glucan endo-1,3-beta-glucosidase 4 isoform X2 n=1 Tax=Magnolia sinica TaxID=86752 RepID=UPI00265916B7|nr:glucan endo-1,3-beta-glucosidase 4 isoform X2 [Magnolia sinica]